MKKIITIILYFISFIINLFLTTTLFYLSLFDECYGILIKSNNKCLFSSGSLFSLTFLEGTLPIFIFLGLLFLIISIILIININKSNMKNKKILILLIILSLLFNLFTFIIFKYINSDFFNTIYNKYYSSIAFIIK